MRRPGRLVLEDGSIFEGELLGAPVAAAGEVVFNTGMVGYPESLTDPSYAGELLVLTYPLVGNYGAPALVTDRHGLPIGFESGSIKASGLVVSECCDEPSHYRSRMSLDSWLRDQETPGLAGVDTRALTRRLRSSGTMLGAIEPAGETAERFDPASTNMVATVSCDQVVRYRPRQTGGEQPVSRSRQGRHGGPATVLLVDCGVKTSIIRALLERGIEVIRVPHDHYFLDMDFDGVLVSNGPGDPQTCRPTIRNVERALALGRPILGICLGHQILALAVGATTFKLRFGHRGQNQPCLELDEHGRPTVRCLMTSQNHGYAVRAESLPDDWQAWYVNANDGTVEGIRHLSKPLWGIQFHPEANPGPVDAAVILDRFAELVRGGAR